MKDQLRLLTEMSRRNWTVRQFLQGMKINLEDDDKRQLGAIISQLEHNDNTIVNLKELLE